MKFRPPQIDERANKYWLNEKHQLHRLDGPAIEWSSGYKEWWVEGRRHRLDGPAYEGANGFRGWWIDGVQIECSNDFSRHPLVLFHRLCKETL